jgi:hypothetical protein
MEYLRQCVVRCGDSAFAVDSWRSPGCGAFSPTSAFSCQRALSLFLHACALTL